MPFNQIGNNITGGASFGRDVSLSKDGTVIAVGASSSEYVAIYAFESGSWQQRGANITGEAASNFFGGAVSISSDGNTVAIGATNNDDGGDNAGHVRIYNWDGTNWNKRGIDLDGSAERQIARTPHCWRLLPLSE